MNRSYKGKTVKCHRKKDIYNRRRKISEETHAHPVLISLDCQPAELREMHFHCISYGLWYSMAALANKNQGVVSFKLVDSRCPIQLT